MGTLLPATNIDALLAIHAAHPSDQDALINEFIRARWKQFQTMAYQACRRANRDPQKFEDDVTSLMAMEAWNVVKNLVAEGPAKIRSHGATANFNYLIRWSVGNAVTKFFHSEAGGTAASGMDLYIRRQSQIRKTRDEISSREMREPTQAEIIEVTNARLMKTRKSPQQEGILLDESDFVQYSTAEYVPEVIDRELKHENLSYHEDYLLHPAEGQQIVLATIAAAKEVSDELGMVAEIWLGDFYPNGGDATQQVSIMKRTGLPKWTVSRYIARIKQLALEQLESKLSPEDYTPR